MEVHSTEKLKPIRFCYGANSEQFGELYLPAQQLKAGVLHPVMILIHGGYWKDNHNLNSYATSQLIPEFVAAGWAVWNLEYRRMNSIGENIKAPWPSVFVDVAHAVDFLRTIANIHALDVENVSVIGHSAGGCLALWAASRFQIPATSPLFQSNPLRITSAMSISGVLNLTHAEDLSQPEQIVRLMGGTSENYPERYRACDPSQLYDSSVRTFVIHGENDATVSVRQAQYYFQKAPETIQLEIWQDADHFSMLPHDGIWSTKQWTNLKAAINTFFKTSF